MRMLKLSVTGVASIGLLVGMTAGVVAQPEQQAATGPDHAWVTLVSEDCDGDESQTSEGQGDGYDWWRGYTFSCDLEFSDPRVSGTLTGVFNDDCLGDQSSPCVYWNSEHIDGPDGSWSGWVWGTHRAEGPQATPLATSLKVFTGQGGYEGLTFLVLGLGDLGEQDFYGLIYEGAPPPLPDPVEPPTE